MKDGIMKLATAEGDDLPGATVTAPYLPQCVMRSTTGGRARRHRSASTTARGSRLIDQAYERAG